METGTNAGLNDLLQEVAVSGLWGLLPETVEACAVEIWWGKALPLRSVLNGPHVDDAYRLLARLSAFPAVSLDRRRKLLLLARDQIGAAYLDVHPALEQVLRPHLPRLQQLQASRNAR